LGAEIVVHERGIHPRPRGDPPYRRPLVPVLPELVHGRGSDPRARIGLPRGTSTAAPGHHGVSLRPAQHSMTLTARPPSLVSLYFVDMSSPVWRIVSTTASSETKCSPSPRRARRAAVTAVDAAIAFRSMHGICTSPPIGSQV